METIADAIDKRGSIEAFWKLVDPENKYSYSTAIKEWYALSLTDQRKLYLYLLYRKWRGSDIYGEPYYQTIKLTKCSRKRFDNGSITV